MAKYWRIGPKVTKIDKLTTFSKYRLIFFDEIERFIQQEKWFDRSNVELISSKHHQIIDSSSWKNALKVTKMSITLNISVSLGQYVFFLQICVCVCVFVYKFNSFLFFIENLNLAQLIELDWFVVVATEIKLISNKAMKIIAFRSYYD